MDSNGTAATGAARRNALISQNMKNAFIINDDELNKMQTMAEQ